MDRIKDKMEGKKKSPSNDGPAILIGKVWIAREEPGLSTDDLSYCEVISDNEEQPVIFEESIFIGDDVAEGELFEEGAWEFRGYEEIKKCGPVKKVDKTPVVIKELVYIKRPKLDFDEEF